MLANKCNYYNLLYMHKTHTLNCTQTLTNTHTHAYIDESVGEGEEARAKTMQLKWVKHTEGSVSFVVDCAGANTVLNSVLNSVLTRY